MRGVISWGRSVDCATPSVRRHDTQYDNIQHHDTQHNDNQHNDTQHNVDHCCVECQLCSHSFMLSAIYKPFMRVSCVILLNVVMLSVMAPSVRCVK
jgi:hypothetical protein